MNLVIVESPTKAKTISRFLDKDYLVLSSQGHVRDLPKSTLGIDLENNYQPKYIVLKKAQKKVSELKAAVKKSTIVTLATDEDREGEAIAWHLIEALKITDQKTIQRIVFHEITKKAIVDALKNPRDLDKNLIDAQQARRILDRLVGYKLSPFLWKKIAKGLSAGRVQSVAVRFIVEREREIGKFKPQEYWTINAELKKNQDQPEKSFVAKLIIINDKKITKLQIKNEQTAAEILQSLQDAKYQIQNVTHKSVCRYPAPPFITSTLQQAAALRLGWTAQRTMLVAQQLYEGIELDQSSPVGLITYMRTDSYNLAPSALQEAKKLIVNDYGSEYSLPQPRFYKTKSKSAQEAHEAIRPAQASLVPSDIKQYLDNSQYKLYDLIWRRFIACQMKEATLDQTSVDIAAKNYIFRASGSILKFDGWLKVYPTKFAETLLPQLQKNEMLDLVKIDKEQHFTLPPPKFTEASLIKQLEEHGIGRPSTYAPIIYTIQQRGYVVKNEQKQFIPTDIGFLVTDMLVEHFPKVVDIQFTAHMEDDLDEIANGKMQWQSAIKEFYEPFAKNLEDKYETVKTQKIEEPTDKICPQCGSAIVIKQSRFGKFYACSNFPDCRYTESILNKTGIKCPKCHKGDVVAKKTKKQKVFYGCSRYPDCDYSLWDKPTGKFCPKCNSMLVEKKQKIFCSNKECDFQEK